ncbi:MAG: exo-alpha-sialidase, partial [Gemmatimonadales bacterium]
MGSSSKRSRRVLLLVGTRKGLFLASSDLDRRKWSVEGPHLAGYEIYHAVLDPRDCTTAYAAAHHVVWGAHVYRSDDCGRIWAKMPGVPHYDDDDDDDEGTDRTLKAIWYIGPAHADAPDTVFAGIEPAGLFVSRDRGRSWNAVDGLNHHATNKLWQPSGGALALHSVQVDPRDSRRIYAAISAGGVYRSDDCGATWTTANRGVRADYLP